MINQKRDQLYLLAAVEIDGKKMPDRIVAVRQAIKGRLQDLERRTDRYGERRRLNTSLKILDILEADAQK